MLNNALNPNDNKLDSVISFDMFTLSLSLSLSYIYILSTDDDRSINVTKHTPLSATENTESSHKQKGTTAAAQKSTETKGDCEVTAENKRENISLIYTHQPLPEVCTEFVWAVFCLQEKKKLCVYRNLDSKFDYRIF